MTGIHTPAPKGTKPQGTTPQGPAPQGKTASATWTKLAAATTLTAILAVIATLLGGAPAAYAADANLPPSGATGSGSSATETLEAADGLVYLASKTTDAVTVYTAPMTADSTPVRTISLGAGADPVGVTVDEGLLYVANEAGRTANAGWVGVYTAGGADTSNTELRRVTGLSSPRSVGVDDHHLYVVGHFAAGNIRVMPRDTAGPAGKATLRTITATLPWPVGTKVHNGRIYTALSGSSNSVVVHTAGASAANVAVATISGSMSNAFDVEVAEDLLLVANEANNSVNAYRLTDTGSVTPQWRIVGSATGLAKPTGLAYDNGTLYVAARDTGIVREFSPLPENPAPVRSVGHSIPQSNSPWDVAIGGGYLYYPSGNANTIHRLSLTGPSNGQAIASVAASRARAVAANDTHVFWTNGSSIGRSRHGAAKIEPAFITLPATAFAIEVDANYIYWTYTGSGAIGRANLDGTGVVTEFMAAAATGASTLYDVTANGSHIYWSDGAGKRIGRANLDGTGVEPAFVSTGTVTPGGIAVNDTEVFYVARGGTTLNAAQIDSPSTVRLVTNQSVNDNPSGLLLHDGWLYWSESNTDGEVMRATTAGTDVMDVAHANRTLLYADHLETEDGLVYVADRTSGNVEVHTAGTSGLGLPVRIVPVGGSPTGIAVSNGLLYVGIDGGVAVYPAGGSGTSNTRQRLISTSNSDDVAVAGGEVFVAQNGANRVIVFAAGGSGASNSSIRSLTVSTPKGVAVHDGELFVSSSYDSSSAIRVFNSSWVGNITGVPKRSITGAMVSDPYGLAIGQHAGQTVLWATMRATNNVTAYPINASGTSRPVVALSGSRTGFYAPTGIDFDPAGNIYVGNAGAPVSMRIFAPQPTITAVASATGRPGDTVTVTGTSFDGVSEVRFAGVPTAFTRLSSTQVRATVPFAPSGPADVTVVTARAPATADEAFTFLPVQPGEHVCSAAPALVNGNFDSYVPPSWSPDRWAVVPQGTPGLGWKTTGVYLGQPDGIELEKNQSIPPASGPQSAEINAEAVGMIYQDLPTTPGQTLRWSLAHSSTATGTVNTMRVMIGDPDDALVQSGPNISTNRKTWTYHTGTYTVPEGQTVTRFGFETVTPTNSAGGNLIDDITFTALGCPEAPSDLQATPEGGAARITFTPGADGGEPITGYAYSINDGPWSMVATNGTASPVRIGGLTDGQTYSVRLRALNTTAAGQPSAPVTFTAGGPSLGGGGSSDVLNLRTVSTISVNDALSADAKLELRGQFGGTVHATVSATSGSVWLGTTAGLTASPGFPANFSGPKISFTGTQAAVNAALASLQYTAGQTSGPGSIQVIATSVLDGYAYNPANGHYYELVTDVQTWASARDDARSRALYGTRGYLATITSADENAVVTSLAGANAVWIGASDAESEGNWTWMDGPEEGQVFWSSDACATGVVSSCAGTGSYNRWASSNPSNSGSTEHFGELSGANSQWNDVTAATTRRAVVEYSEPDGGPVTVPGATRTIEINTRVANVNDDACVAAPQLVNGNFDVEFPNLPWNTTYFAEGFKNPLTSDPTLGWRNTAENNVEIIKSGANGQVAHSGGQYAELNASIAGTLYQILPTTPGSTLRWSLWHRARIGDGPAANTNPNDTNTMRVLIGSTGAGGAIDAGLLTQSGGNLVSPPTQWRNHTGTYTVPAGQTQTVFAFQSTNGSSIGNLLDSVRFTTAGCAGAPSGVSVAPGDEFATISFTPGDDGGYPLINYAYSLDGGPWTPLATPDTTSPIVMPDLVNGLSYTLQLRPLNPAGVGMPTPPITITLPAPDAAVDSWKTVAMTPDGTLYTALRDSGKIVVFAPDASGNATPVRTITGEATGLSNRPHGIAAAADGTIYVTTFDDNAIRVFAPDANGDAPPVRIIRGTATGLSGPNGITLTRDGITVWVASQTNRSVRAFNAAANGNATPVRVIAGNRTGLVYPRAVAVAPGGKLYVSDRALRVFTDTTNGNTAPQRVITTGGPAGITDPAGLAVDPATGTVYSADLSTNAIRAYAPTANGTIRPIRILTGTQTGLDRPTSLAIHTTTDGVTRLYAASPGNNSIRGYVVPENKR